MNSIVVLFLVVCNVICRIVWPNMFRIGLSSGFAILYMHQPKSQRDRGASPDNGLCAGDSSSITIV